MLYSVSFFISSCSFAYLALIENHIDPAKYDDMSLKGFMAVMLIISGFAIVMLYKRLEDNNRRFEDNNKRLELLSNTFLSQSFEREKAVLNIVSLSSEKVSGLTNSIDKLNQFMENFVKNAVGEVFEAGLTKYNIEKEKEAKQTNRNKNEH